MSIPSVTEHLPAAPAEMNEELLDTMGWAA